MSPPDIPASGATLGPEGSPPSGKKLDSWGEIASYLGREVRTVQRWEQTEDLPVHRHEHKKKSTVYAYAGELDAWIKQRQPKDDPEADAAFVPEPDVDAPPEKENGEPILLVTPVKPAPRTGKLLTLLLAAAAILCVAVYGAYHWFQVQAITRTKVRLVVLPFKNLSGDASQNYISEGLTEDITTQLGRLDPAHLGVIAPTSAKIIASKMKATLPVPPAPVPSRSQPPLPTAVSAEALAKSRDDYLRGKFTWGSRFDLPSSIRYFEQAIREDPSYALAYAGLAGATALIGQVPNDGIPPRDAKPKAKEAAQHALQLDPRLAEAHAILGNVAMSYDWDLATAEKELQRAIELNPNDPSTHEWYCHLLIVERRNADALTEVRHALDIDPINPLFHAVLAETYYYRRDYDSAIEEAKQVVKLRPDFPYAQFWLGSALREKKMYPEAIAAFQRGREYSHDLPFLVMAYGHAQALAGNAKEAREALRKLEALRGTRFVPPLYLAAIHLGLGEKDEAFRLLDLAYMDRVDRLVYLGVDPIADPIRSDPRFVDLLAKIGVH